MDAEVSYLVFEKFILDHKDYLVFLTALSSILIIVVGWFVNSAKARGLQKKQLAISILNDSRYEENWVKSSHSLGCKISDPAYTKSVWTDLFNKAVCNDKELDEEEKQTWLEVRTVLNTYEFVAMSVNCQAVNEYVIKESWSQFYKDFYVVFIEQIEQARKEKEEPNLYINFTTLSVKWHPSLKKKEGKPASRWRL